MGLLHVPRCQALAAGVTVFFAGLRGRRGVAAGGCCQGLMAGTGERSINAMVAKQVKTGI